MVEKQNVVLGFLLIIIMSTIVYVQFENVKMRVDFDKSTFYTFMDGRHLVAGRESNKMFEGTKRLYRNRGGITVDTFFEGDSFTIVRRTPYIRGPVIIDTWVFEGSNKDIARFPVDHSVRILNGVGYIYEYNVRDLVYPKAMTIKNVPSPQVFGRNMKIEWSDESYWNTVYKSGIMKVRYRPDSDDVTYKVRLYDPTLTADGSGDDAKYELQYVINLTAASADAEVCIGIDHPDYGVNFSCGAPPHTLLFNLSNLSVSDFNGSTSLVFAPNGSTARFILSNNSELASLAINISGTAVLGVFPANISFKAENNVTQFTLIGNLVNNSLFQDEYIRDGVRVLSGDILFPRAGVQTILMEITNPKVNGTWIINWTGNESNIGNAFDAFDFLTNGSDLVIQNNLEVNEVGNRLFYDELLNINITDLLWTESQTSSCSGTACTNSITFVHGTNTEYLTIVSIQSGDVAGRHSQGTLETTEVTFDSQNYLGFEFNASFTGSCAGNPGPNVCPGGSAARHNFLIRLTDGTTTVTLRDISGSGTSFQNAPVTIPEQRFRALFIRDDSDVISLVNVSLNNSFVTQVSVASLDPDVAWTIISRCEVQPGDLNSLATSTCTIQDGFSLVGLTLDNSSLEGIGNYSSEPVFTAAANDITSAILTWTSFIRYNRTEFETIGSATNDSAVNIDAFLSADNGTTWQEVISGTTEVFDTPGLNLKYRFNISTLDPLSVPDISNIRIQIIPGLLENFSIDIGSNGGNEFNISIVNGTNSTTITDGSMKLACASRLQEACNVTIDFISGSAGLFHINFINYTHNPNPIRFRANESVLLGMSNVNDPGLTVNFSDGNVTLSGADLRYWGSGNVTVTAEDSVSADDSLILQFRYSRFSITSLIPWFLLVPSTPDSKDVEPEGQRFKFSEPIFNVTANSQNDDNMNLSFQFNDTLDSCIVLFASNETDMTPASILPNNQSLITPAAWGDMIPGENRPIYIKGNFTDCNASTARSYDPFNFFNSLCRDCVRNDLQNNTVFI